MLICIRVGGVEHCYFIPIVLWPVTPVKPGPGPVNYPQLFQDGVLVASFQAALSNVADEGVRSALQSGVAAAMKALQSRAGEHVTVRPAQN
ncbi:MAG TPA: hypothetical protein VMT86_11390 [Bryobacteraceae bacterium]|nr:hypothetical protein [Bryobacteraceae bacterium]